ncbi:uncharacterized protein N7483_009092 [Penicillium malachiteum]|uniref:uncharacterized protein n=1 Tax=Penicillium malachiteum TaxID=1324776 RepID=UPI002546E60C|nr:uncharacterized protein N7483_009092 [Penicillium malachiteum]KAJ5721158.1 hypothetical protein N7483_009092 [Penicillium malachiteum]
MWFETREKRGSTATTDSSAKSKAIWSDQSEASSAPTTAPTSSENPVKIEKRYSKQAKSKKGKTQEHGVKRFKAREEKKKRDKEIIGHPGPAPGHPSISDCDVDYADLETRIERCRYRIAQGVCVQINTLKLAALEKRFQEQQKVMALAPGLSWPTICRLESLKIIEEELERQGDPCKELLNVRAIMNAYQSQRLEVNGNVTFWCNGELLAGPQRFNWDDFWRLNTAENRKGSGFWLECLNHTVRLKTSNNLHQADFRPEVDMNFLDDTGSSIMMIFKDDMQKMLGVSDTEIWPWDHILGYAIHNVANGASVVVLHIAVEVNMVEREPGQKASPKFMGERWTTAACGIHNEFSWERGIGQDIRLNGPFLRTALYTGTAPEVIGSKVKMYIAKSRDGLLGKHSSNASGGDQALMPSVDIQYSVDPDYSRPYGWWKGIDPTNGLEEPCPFYPPISGPPGKMPWELKP